MRQAFALFAALSLAAPGCTFSELDPDASVHISGRALDAAGKPLTNATVLLFKQADLGEVVFGSILTVGTLSTICLLPEAPAICREAKTATTDGDGRYEFDLKGSDTQGTLGTESTLNVVFSGGAGKASTTISFTAKDNDITLPRARLWSAAPAVSQSSGEIRLSWSPLPSGTGRDATYSAELFEATSTAAVWSEVASGRSADIDARVLEDRSGSVAAGARTELSGGGGAGDLRASYLSKRLPVRGTSGPPPSRGRPCAAVTGTARAKDGRFLRCAATDGDLDQPARLGGRRGATVTGVVIDLGATRPVRLVVARGFIGQFLVEVSDDGRTYRTVATSSGSAVALSPQGQPTARFVRLRSPAGLDQSLLSELSVW